MTIRLMNDYGAARPLWIGDGCGEERVVGLGVEQLPDQGRPVVELVDDGVLRTVVRPRQGQDQWKYWPPSMTIVLLCRSAGVYSKIWMPARSIEPNCRRLACRTML